MFFTLALLACTPEPASIKFDGAESITVNSLDAVAVSKATVLDKDGKALDPQPQITWSVGPDTVAKLDGEKVQPIATGEAKVEAKVGEVKGAYKFVVALADKLEIAGYDAAVAWPVAGTTQFTSAVKAGETVLEGQTVTWASSDTNVVDVDAAGLATGKADGKATITATSGALTATVEVTIGGAPAATAAVE